MALKNCLTRYTRGFPGLPTPLVYMSVLMSGPHYFGSCSFTGSLEIGKYVSLSFVLFQGCFSYTASLAIPYEF